MQKKKTRKKQYFKFAVCLAGWFLSVSAVFAVTENIPQRIISLGSFVTEELYSLGVEDKIVGVTTYCQRPARAKNKEKAGNIVEVNLEKVLALKPDIVFATPLTDRKAKEKLKNLGVNVIDLGQVKDFEEICQQFLMIADILGEKETAAKIVNNAQGKVKLITEKTAGHPPLKVFIQVGVKPLFTLNKEFYVNDMIEKAGGINIARNAVSGIYSREKVVEQNPDHIIIAGMGLTPEREKSQWQRFSTVTAVSQGQVHIIDQYMICSPTPESFANALEKIAAFIYPQDFIKENKGEIR